MLMSEEDYGSLVETLELLSIPGLREGILLNGRAARLNREYEVRITKQAAKDIGRLSPKMAEKLKSILTEVLSKTPYERR